MFATYDWNHIDEEISAFPESKSADSHYVDCVEGVSAGGVGYEASAVDCIGDDTDHFRIEEGSEREVLSGSVGDGNGMINVT